MPFKNKKQIVTALDSILAKRPKPVTKKTVKGLIKASQELKYSALDYMNDNVDNVFTIAQNPCLMVQGDSATTRTGNEILVDKIEWNMTVTYQDVYNTYRFILFVNKQTNGADMTNGTLFQGFATAGVNSMLNPSTTSQYRIIWDKQFHTTAYEVLTGVGTGTLNGNSVKQIRGSKTFKRPIRVKYTTNAGTIADIQTNAIQLGIFSDSAAVLHPIVEGSVRIRFRDA